MLMPAVNLASWAKALLWPAIATLLIYLLSLAIYNRYFHPYSSFPGPFWASITDLWYFRVVRLGLDQHVQLPLHQKYGPMVRITPNQIQISNPEAIETIYGPGNGFTKSEFYSGFSSGIAHRPSSFEMRDEREHMIRRRIVAPLYTQSSILRFEPCVDRIISLFYSRMEGFAQSGEKVDMSTWLHKYTFDVLGELYFGRKGGFGMVRDGTDYNNWCALMESMPPLASAITYIWKPLRPLVYLLEMAWPSTRQGAMGVFDIEKQSHKAVEERLKEREEGKERKGDVDDLLGRLLDLVNTEGGEGSKSYWTTLDVTAEVWAIIWAGADTTAIALTSIFYHLQKNPGTLRKLRGELELAFQEGRLSYPLRFGECIKLNYLHAVVREGMRMHSSLGLGLPRIVPPGGAEICGRYFPGGYTVTMNSCAVNFDKTIYGEDSEVFRPERWLEDVERAKEMERHSLQFGYGPRICIGRHITNVEMYKLLPTILRNFEFEGIGPREKEWVTFGGWFHQQKGVDVVVKRRRQREEGVVVEIPEGGWRDG